MSSYDPSKTYLLDLDGKTVQARYSVMHDIFLTRCGATIGGSRAVNVREAIILDPQNPDVQALLAGDLTVSELDRRALALVKQIAGQLPPPKKVRWPVNTVLELVNPDAGSHPLHARAGARAVVTEARMEGDEYVKVDWHRDLLSKAQTDGLYLARSFAVIWKPSS